MVTTWLDQNKAFRQALFSAELIFPKQLRAKAVFKNLWTTFFFFFFLMWGGLRVLNFHLCTTFGPTSDRDPCYILLINLIRPVHLVPFFFVTEEFDMHCEMVIIHRIVDFNKHLTDR